MIASAGSTGITTSASREPAARRQALVNAREQRPLLRTVEMVHGERRHDDVEGSVGERVGEVGDDEAFDVAGPETVACDIEHARVLVDQQESSAGTGVEHHGATSCPARGASPASTPSPRGGSLLAACRSRGAPRGSSRGTSPGRSGTAPRPSANRLGVDEPPISHVIAIATDDHTTTRAPHVHRAPPRRPTARRARQCGRRAPR